MTRRDAAYHEIRSRVLSGSLPPGSRLSHRALAREIGVSFIPVREALSQLASEGLVEHRPRVGTFVSELSRDELAELYDLREALECHVTAKMAGRLSHEQLAAMEAEIAVQQAIVDELAATGRSVWDDAQDDRWRQADAAFHRVLLEAGGNARLLKAVADLRVMVYCFGFRQRGRQRAGLLRIINDHRQIVRALASGDRDEARRTMAEHLRQGCAETLDFFDRGRLQKAAGLGQEPVSR